MIRFLSLIILLKSFDLKSQNQYTSHWNTNNPSVVLNDKNTFILKYENQFFIKEWNNKLLSATINNKNNYFIFNISQKGNANFSENKFTFAYTKNLTPKLYIGLGAELFFIQQIEVSSTPSFIKPYGGLLYNLNNKNRIFCSFNTQNLTPIPKAIPENINTQWEYKFNEIITGLFGFSESFENKHSFEGLIDIKLNDRINSSLAISSSENPIQLFSYIKMNNWHIMILNGYHQKLGSSNSIGLSFSW